MTDDTTTADKHLTDVIESAIDGIAAAHGCSRFEAAERLVAAVLGEPVEPETPTLRVVE
jgi:hypothetical protein